MAKKTKVKSKAKAKAPVVAKEPVEADVIKDMYGRQGGICPVDRLQFPINVIGAGSNGSYIILCLAKMGCGGITVWDDDIVSKHNLSNQLCRVDVVGKPKVEALSDLILATTGKQVVAKNVRYEKTKLRGVVIAAVDSMETRQSMWDLVKGDSKVKLFIDPRMGAEVARVYAINPSLPSDQEFFEDNMYTDDEALDAPCNARSINFCPQIIGGIVGSLVKGFAMTQRIPKEIVLDIPRFKVLVTM